MMTSSDDTPAVQVRSAKDWVRILAKYRESSTRRSILELLVTLVPFALLWVLAWASMSISYRLPLGLMRAGRRYWVSAMGTSAMIALILAAMIWLGGPTPVVLIYLPTVVVAATIGMWLFYVQHQFEETHWAENADWQLHEAALAGSSYYVLPAPLRWLSANIGI